MPPSRRPLLALVIAALAVGAWVLGRRHAPFLSAGPGPAPAPSAAPLGPVTGHRLPLPASAAAVSPGHPAFPSIHRHLRQLLEIQTGDDEARDRLVQTLLAELTADNMAAVLPTLSREELRTAFGTEALARWLQLDPAAAAAWIGGRSDAGPGEAALVAGALLPDPAALNAYGAELPDGKFKEEVLTAAGLQILSRDPAEAMALARQLGAGPGQTNLLETLAYDWTARDPSAALQWIMGVPEPALREGLLAMGAKALAVSDPALAADWLAAGVQSPELFRSTALALAETWVDRAPAAAAAWVGQLGPGPARQGAVDVILRHWLAADPAAAQRWILSLPERDEILRALATAEADPAGPPSEP